MNGDRQQWGQLVRRGAASTRDVIAVGAAQFPGGMREGVGRLWSFVTPIDRHLGRATLAAFVVAPTLIFFLYTALIQSPVYETMTKIAVRGQKGQTSSEHNISSGPIQAHSPTDINQELQDAYIILNYIKSAAVIRDLGGRAYLEKYYSSRRIDYLSRLGKDDRIEDQLSYWRKRVDGSVDSLSGVLTITTQGFTPKDAVAVADRILERSEKLINEITLRNREDALKRAKYEVSLAADKLAADREAVKVFRQKNALIDPSSRAQSIGDLIGKLARDKIDIENSLATLKGVVRPDSPTQRVQRTKLAAIDQQIAELRRSLTESGSDKTVASQIGDYERLKLGEEFSQAIYNIAQNSYVTARKNLESQQVYVVTIVPPLLPGAAVYPQVFYGTLAIFLSLLIVWSIVALVTTSIRDHML